MRHSVPPAAVLAAALAAVAPAKAADPAIASYDSCASGKVDPAARPEALDRAIRGLEAALRAGGDTGAAVGRVLLRAYYLRGTFTPAGASARRAWFDRGRDLAARLSAAHPADGDLHYLYAVCLGRWGEEHGKLAAARQGVADRMKSECEAAIRLGPDSTAADGYRALGRLHNQCPRIPLLLSWPSNAKAAEYLRKSEELVPGVAGTRRYLAEALADLGRREEARQWLRRCADTPPRPGHAWEDRSQAEACAQSLGQK